MTRQADVRAYRGRVEGRVQGVSFRANMQRQARLWGVAGWVRNRPDGSVEFLIQGQADAVQALLDWARRGPPAGSVDACNVSETGPEAGLDGFEIRF